MSETDSPRIMDHSSNIGSSNKSPYRSCFFVDGVPILPPLMTADRCTEVLYYKQLAIAVEQRLRILRENQDMVQHDDNLVSKPEDERTPNTAANLNEILEFDSPHDASISQKASNNSKYYNSASNQDSMPVNYKGNVSNHKVETVIRLDYPQIKNKLQNLKLSSGSSLSTQSFNRKNSYTIINNNEYNQNLSNKNRNQIESNRSEEQMKPNKDQSGALVSVSSTPSLTRSNSYTLEEPSALLKAQLQSQGIYVSDSNINVQKETSPKSGKRKGWDLESAKEQWAPQTSERTSITICDPNYKKKSPSAKTKIASPKKLPNKTNVSSINMNKLKANDSSSSSNKSKFSRKSSPLRNQKPNSNLQRSIALSLNYLNTFGLPTVLPYATTPPTKNESIHNTTPTSTPRENEGRSRRVTPDRTSGISESKPLFVATTPTSQSQHSEKNSKEITSISQDNIRILFNKLKEEHAKQMEELLRRQKQDQESLQKAFEHQQNLLLLEIKKSYTSSNISSDDDLLLENKQLHCDDVTNNIEQKINYQDKQTNDQDSYVEKQRSTFIKQSETVLAESQILLNRANTSIDSYLETRTETSNISNGNSILRPSSAGESTTIQCTDYGETSGGESDMYTMDSDCMPYNDSTNSAQLISELKDEDIAIKSIQNSYLNKYMESFTNCTLQPLVSQPEKLHKEKIENLSPEPKKESCSNVKYQMQNNSSSEWNDKINAASVINAAVRGYLVRRLMRTQHIQTIKQTIQETLLCALQLHRDSSGQVKLSDVELHRRLIEQLNAACFNLHDVFFNMTTQQKLHIIAADRERLMGMLAMSNPKHRIKNSGCLVDSKYSNALDAFMSKTRTQSLDLVEPIYSVTDNLKSHKNKSEHSNRGITYNTPRRPWR